MTDQTCSFGRGAVTYRNGRPRPIRYSEVKPRQRLVYGNSTTNWTTAGNCTIAMADVVTPEGNTESLLKVTATGANVNSFYDYTFPVVVAPGGKYVAFWADIYVTRPTTSSTAGTGSAGLTHTFFLYVGSLGSLNNLQCALELTWGWNRVFFCKEDFSTAVGTGNWDTSTFMGIRGRLAGTTGHTHSVWIREMGWI